MGKESPEEFLKAVIFAGGILQEKTGLNLSSEEISRIESERRLQDSWKRIISQTTEALFVIFPNFLGEMKRFQ